MFLPNKYKRAVSPVVTTIFLFGVIIAGISVSLGIIYPAVNELDDQIMLETSGSSLLTIDNNLQDLMASGIDSEINSRIDLGIGGAFQYNNEILSTIRLLDDGNIADEIKMGHPRLQIVQEVKSNYLERGESHYFTGAGDQSYLFLNDNLRSRLGWSIINQSRGDNSNFAVSSLSYRSIISSSVDIDPNANVNYNLTITIQMVNLTLSAESDTRSTGSNVGVGMKFLGSTTRFTDFIIFTGDLTMNIDNRFPEAGSTITSENPLNAEYPGIPYGVRFEFKYHQIEITI